MKTLKSKFFTIIGLFVLAVGIYSCSEHESVQVQDSHAVMLDNLKAFNNDFIKKHPQSAASQRGGFWGKVLQVAAVATGDLSGAAAGVWGVQKLAIAAGAATSGTGYAVVSAAGAVVGAAGGSYMAYCTVKPRACANNRGGLPELIEYEDRYDINFEITNPKFVNLNELGYLHNSILEESYYGGISQKDWLTAKSISGTSYLLKTASEDDSKSLMNTLFQSSELANVKSGISNAIGKYSQDDKFDYKVLLQSLLNDQLINQNLYDVLDLFLNVYNKAESFEDFETIIKFYVAEIENSNLNDTEKEALLAAFSVAAKSPYFWTE